jgi:DNA adenine methylase
MRSATTPSLLNESANVVNVASVPQRSPFRYPGGKTWFIPHLREWIGALGSKPRVFIEPFAGGGIASLTVAMERLADRVVMAELDSRVAAVWKTILGAEAEWLVARIRNFRITRESVIGELCREPANEEELAFQTILRNRVQRGGIIAPGASLVKNGENNRGVASRWYPETLSRRIQEIHRVRDRIEFHHRDAFDVIRAHAARKSAAFFIDPPYTAGGKKAGSRLYLHNHIDHRALFSAVASVQGQVLLTYDDSREVQRLADDFGFFPHRVAMKTTHHTRMAELAITNFPMSTRLPPPSPSESLLCEEPATARPGSSRRNRKAA